VEVVRRRKLGKRDAENLLAAIDDPTGLQDAVHHALCALLGASAGPGETPSTWTGLITATALTAGWDNTRRDLLAAANEGALQDLAIELAEVRQL
jgi:hypothetical protein